MADDWQRSRSLWARIAYDRIFKATAETGPDVTEDRGIISFYGKAPLPAGVWVEARVRADLRWIGDDYSTRYRFRVDFALAVRDRLGRAGRWFDRLGPATALVMRAYGACPNSLPANFSVLGHHSHLHEFQAVSRISCGLSVAAVPQRRQRGAASRSLDLQEDCIERLAAGVDYDATHPPDRSGLQCVAMPADNLVDAPVGPVTPRACAGIAPIRPAPGGALAASESSTKNRRLP